MPSSLLCLEGSPNRHSREPVQRNLGCPLKRHDTIYNVSHNKTQTWTQGTTSCSRRATGLKGVSRCLQGRGAVCVTLTLPSSALYSGLPACFSALCCGRPCLLSPLFSPSQCWLAKPGFPSNPNLRQAIFLHCFLIQGLLASPQSKAIWDGLDLRHVSSCLRDASYKLCLFSLHSALLARLLEAMGSSGSLLCGGCVLFVVVPLLQEKIIRSLGLKESPSPSPPRASTAPLSQRVSPRMWFSMML